MHQPAILSMLRALALTVLQDPSRGPLLYLFVAAPAAPAAKKVRLPHIWHTFCFGGN